MSTTVEKRRIPILLWPLVLLWKFVTLVANLTGIVMALVLGAVFMIIGWVLIGTIIGAVIGIPLFIIGLLLFIRGLY
jgi:hypothetical protein